MTAYYNEKDPNAAVWLRELIAQGHVAAGEVDERSIVDVRPADLAGFTQCHFFAGIGGWSLALRYAGWGDDIPVWTGSCPCQPFSAAGQRKGFDDERHLWPEFKRLIAERRPAIVFGEQVASATAWLGLVRGDLEALDYAVGAMPIQAASAGADHLRDRFWFMAHANDARLQGRTLSAEGTDQRAAGPNGVANDLSNTERERVRGKGPGTALATPAGMQGANEQREWLRSDAGPVCDDRSYEWVIGADGKARRVKSGICLLVDGFPNRVGLLRGFGNAIDPRPAAQFIGAARESLGA